MTADHHERAALDLLFDRGTGFRRTARRFSICADDAEDALRAILILLTKAPPHPPERLAAWMHLVTRGDVPAPVGPCDGDRRGGDCDDRRPHVRRRSGLCAGLLIAACIFDFERSG